jgi:hypothetical protein
VHPGTSAPDLLTHFPVYVEDAEQARAVAETSLHGHRQTDAVEAAYVVPPAEPAEVMDGEALNPMTPDAEEALPASPNFTSRQGYLNRAPDGINARYAWTVPGGRGKGRLSLLFALGEGEHQLFHSVAVGP